MDQLTCFPDRMRPNMTVSMFIFIHNKAFTNTQTDVLIRSNSRKGNKLLAKFEIV